MTGREQLRERNNLAAVAPMAARAVALCEGCPMAKFCADKASAPCETPQAQSMQIEAGGSDIVDLELAARTSYRDELFDSSKNIVMAELQKLPKPKEKLAPSPRLTSLPKLVDFKPIQSPRPKAQANLVKARQSTVRLNHNMQAAPERGEGNSDIIAGILASIVGVKGIATVSSKKSV